MLTNSPYTITIGLEIHAELKTKSKMWCGCKNDPLEKLPNQNICEVCMAHPGTLPVANKEAIKKVMTVGCAVGGKIADFTEFDRKNYFYPDIPKGYQISQYRFPIVTGGKINNIELTRIHLEEDTAKSTHDNDGYTLVDYNRAGVPLMELVTDPITYNKEEEAVLNSVEFARELQRILRSVDASDANMELGQMRVEANISISKDSKLGTKVEVKNINSFRSVKEAIEYEVKRHIELLDSGKQVDQETRGWDEGKQITFSQRKKENAHDYRYFPDPDLPKFYLHKLFDIDEIKKSLPELPKEKRERLKKSGLKDETIDILLDSLVLSKHFDETNKKGANSPGYVRLAGNYITVDYVGFLKKNGKEVTDNNLPSSTATASLVGMIINNELSSRGAKDIIPIIMKEDVDPKEYAIKNNLIQKKDPEILKKIILEVIAENPKQVADYKSGKKSMFMYFVGECMKKSKGSGNPSLFQELLNEILSR